MRENKNYYLEALKLYQKGNLSYALGKCEEGISKNLDDADLLNLKGLILYSKGDLDGASAIWKINRDHNNSDIAKSYLSDVKDDYERLGVFNEAIKDIKEHRITEAINKLKKCSESNFNQIQVNNSLALCYMKKGELELAKYHLGLVYEIDKSNQIAKEIEKELSILDNGNSGNRLKKGIGIVAIIGLIGLASISIKIVKPKEKDEPLANKAPQEQIVMPHIEESKETSNNTNKLTYEEVENKYNDGLEAFNNGEYSEAADMLKEIYEFRIGSHLESHIVFFLGSSLYNLEEYESSEKYLQEYEEKFKDGGYIEETYYKLALLNKNRNEEKSKNYAYNLAYNYPNSIYNNSVIEEILNR